jgi:hypothetical protein
MTSATPLFSDRFSFDGRGPELARVHWEFAGRSLKAIDYTNYAFDGEGRITERDSRGRVAGRFHVTFTGLQVVMITPEEVIGEQHLPTNFSALVPAAIFDMGRTPWLESFDQQHLSKCKHYKLLFYDELFDMICKGVEIHPGSYPTPDAV